MTVRRCLAWVGASALALAGVGCSNGTPGPTPAPTPAPSPAPSPASGGPTSTATPTRPVLGAWHHLVYDAARSTVVLVNGGPEQGHPADAPLELWSWDGKGWQRLAAAGGDVPRWRNFAAVTYDTDRSVLIVHGGLQGRGQPLDETWEWDGQRWSRFPAGGASGGPGGGASGGPGGGPGGREGAKLAYDAARRLTVLIGGVGPAGASPATWGWDGATWRRLATEGPGERFPGLVEYDAARRTVVLYGGHPLDGPVALGDTWLWDGRRWRAAAPKASPGPRFNLAATFHSGLGRLVQVAGGDGDRMYGDMWAWDGATWAKLPDGGLPARQAGGLAHDAGRDRLVLTGGLDQPGTAARLQDVWEWDGTRFTQVLR